MSHSFLREHQLFLVSSFYHYHSQCHCHQHPNRYSAAAASATRTALQSPVREEGSARQNWPDQPSSTEGRERELARLSPPLSSVQSFPPKAHESEREGEGVTLSRSTVSSGSLSGANAVSTDTATTLKRRPSSRLSSPRR